MKRITVTIDTTDVESEAKYALQEVERLIEEGFLMGHDSREDGNTAFHFDIKDIDENDPDRIV